MVKVLGLGDNVCDVYLHTGVMYPGGQALNFAVYAASLGAQADYMGVFGQDAVAAHNQATLDAKSVGRSHCRSYEGENGFARVTLVEGDRVFKGSNRGGVLQQYPIYLDEGDLAYAAGFDLIHTTNNGFTDGLLPALHDLPALVSYDFSFRWNEEDRVERVCPYIDFAFLSCSDLNEEDTAALCRRLHGKGCWVVTATRGSKGATVFDGERFYRQLPDLVKPVDTMGAGDSFATAMLVTLLEQMKNENMTLADAGFRARALPVALKAAAAFSAKNCLVHGAFDCGTPVPEALRRRFYEGI
ncbi:MAG: fructoselysine 6-kinase [Oscillospiraceae bacterium]|nr:fructoselysine 6-kinase [Oscillospiraceae bacterium]